MNRIIVDYMTIVEDKAYELDKSVKLALSKGWDVFGYAVFKDKLIFQTMVKYETDQEKMQREGAISQKAKEVYRKALERGKLNHEIS